MTNLFKEKPRSRGKEKTIRQKELDLLKTLVTGGIILEIVATYFSLMFAAVKYDNPTSEYLEWFNITTKKLSTDPGYCFPVSWSNFGTTWFLLTFVIFVSLIWYYIMQKNYFGTKDLGSAKFENPEDLTTELAEPLGKPGYDDKNNFIYGQTLYIAKNSTYTDSKGVRHEGLHSNNCLVIAETGGGKTYRFVKPNLMQMNCSYVVTDPSGSTLRETGEMLYRFGYNVRSLDIITMINCNQYNPMKYIRGEADVKNIIQSFISNTKKEGETGQSQDPFWDNAMEAFMCAILALLVEYGDDPDIMDGRKYNKAFPTLCELTRMATAGMDPKFNNDQNYLDFCKVSVNEKKPTALGHIFNNIRMRTEGQQKPYCLREWENYKLAPEKTATTILITTAVKLDPFEVQKVINLTSNDTINLDTFGAGRDAIFIQTPQTADGKPYMFLASFLYTQLFSAVFNRGNYDMDGSHSIKLKNGEHVKWFKKDVPVEDIQKELESYKNVHILTMQSRYDENDLYYAIVDDSFSEEEAKSLGGMDEDDAYRRYINYVESHTISRRPTLELANKYIEDLKTAVIKTHRGEANPTTCRFMIDEWANIGEIPDFLKILATVRKYNIVIDVIVQSREQLKRVYEKSYSEIEDNCPITVFLGGSGVETTKAMAEKMGKTSVIVNNVNTDSKKASSGHNVQQRDLMDAAETGKMDMTEELVMLSHYNPVIDKKYETTNHPNYKYSRDFMQRQPGKDKFCIYDIGRFPEVNDNTPIWIEERQHVDDMVIIESGSVTEFQKVFGKTGVEAEEAFINGMQKNMNLIVEEA